MNPLTRLRLPWLFNRHVGKALLWALVVFGTAFAVNLIGIRLTGSIGGWKDWLHAHAAQFFVWRLCLYCAIATFWWQTRRHLQQRPFDADAVNRHQLIGAGAVITVLLHESRWLLHG